MRTNDNHIIITKKILTLRTRTAKRRPATPPTTWIGTMQRDITTMGVELTQKRLKWRTRTRKGDPKRNEIGQDKEERSLTIIGHVNN